jgi:hypothetical protein
MRSGNGTERLTANTPPNTTSSCRTQTNQGDRQPHDRKQTTKQTIKQATNRKQTNKQTNDHKQTNEQANNRKQTNN